MGLLDAFQSHRNELDNTHHGHVTHDVLAGAVAFEAAKAWEKHVAQNGKPANHAKAKEFIAAFTAAAVTHLVETKGLNAWDAHKQKQVEIAAQQQLNETIVVNEYN